MLPPCKCAGGGGTDSGPGNFDQVGGEFFQPGCAGPAICPNEVSAGSASQARHRSWSMQSSGTWDYGAPASIAGSHKSSETNTQRRHLRHCISIKLLRFVPSGFVNIYSSSRGPPSSPIIHDGMSSLSTPLSGRETDENSLLPQARTGRSTGKLLPMTK